MYGSGDKIKIVVGGPSRAGKTLISKLIANQDFIPDDKIQTQIVRIQELRRQIVNQDYHVELWDCGSDQDIFNYLPVLTQDIDGLMLVYDSNQQQESALEKWYIKCAQPYALPIKTCLLIGLNLDPSRSNQQGIQGKLTKLKNIQVTLNLQVEQQSQLQELYNEFDNMIQVCSQRKQELVEKLVMESASP
eukprot:TRINITY_DN11832_c0_g1_i1.p1 TRINITY_DN11832_c0_g1~~TRINITY_DN11832_c0_g1_i1.p1  ORF type:complete len:190 (-),score=22.36 TRINITY_DN11832_c0_g1_i1:142-711(-)